MKSLLPFIIISLIINMTTPSNVVMVNITSTFDLSDASETHTNEVTEIPSYNSETIEENIEIESSSTPNVYSSVISPLSAESSENPLIELSSSLNVTTINTYDENDISNVRLTTNLTAVGSLSLSEVPIDYILTLDGSGSVREAGWNQTIRWAIGFVNSLKETDRIAIITFNNTVRIIHSLNDDQSRQYITDLLNTTVYPEGATFTRGAIENAIQEFINNSTDSIPKFLFLVTDGVPTVGSDPCQLTSQLRSRSIKTLIIGVGSWDRNRLRCLVENPYQDLIDIDTYDALEFHPEDLSAILRNLANVTANNVQLTLVFNPDITITYFNPYPNLGSLNNYTFVIPRMNENDTRLFTLDLQISGEGTIPILLDTSKLQYQPINQTTQIMSLSPNFVEIVVLDIVEPVVTAPSDITVEAESAQGTMVSFTASAVDDRDGDLIPTCTPESDSVFTLGITAVSCEAIDSSGNTGSSSFSVYVVDTTEPTLMLPSDLTIEAEDSFGTMVTFEASASDIVDGTLIPLCIPSSGDVFQLGLTNVVCSVIDIAGNEASATFAITIVDTTAPLVTSPDDLTVFAGIGSHYINWTLTDYFPENYEVFQNDTLIGSGVWVSGDIISINIDLLTDGLHVFRIVANDSSGNIASDTVLVTFLSIPEQFASIREDILNLDLNKCKDKALLNKLDAALKDFENGNYKKSIKHLYSLINQIEGLSHHKISPEDADALVLKIERLIDNIRLYGGIEECNNRHGHDDDHGQHHEHHHSKDHSHDGRK